MTDPARLVEQAVASRDRHAVARLVAIFEDGRDDAATQQDDTLRTLQTYAATRARTAPILGVTGTPGSGKSTLLWRATEAMLTRDAEMTLAVVAVDPSSPTSGGAFLGDRTRMQPSRAGERLFFRSQASAAALGGLAPSTYEVCRALACLYDAVIVETVGIGQSEADIRHLADRVYLVVSPLGGDEVQYLKAGIVEVPDAFVVSKWDEPPAARAYHQLRSSMSLARPFDGDDVPIFRTSAKDGTGIDELADDLLTAVARGGRSHAAADAYFFERWVVTEWGQTGLRHLRDALGGATAFLDGSAGTGADRARFTVELTRHLAGS